MGTAFSALRHPASPLKCPTVLYQLARPTVAHPAQVLWFLMKEHVLTVVDCRLLMNVYDMCTPGHRVVFELFIGVDNHCGEHWLT